MRFTIVTPSFRSSRWLKLCIPSVADQGLDHEHIVQDSCSDDDTQEWLPQDRRVTAVIEKDRGMYDAVNRGWSRARGEILSYLNCDEQYLPGALRAVDDYFARNPEIDVVFGDAVVVDDQGRYVCERRALKPQVPHTLVSGNLSFLTAATFVRRRIVAEMGFRFDPALRDVGDADWAIRLVRSKVRLGLLRQFTSVFTDTGQNMNFSANATREKQALLNRAPGWARRFRAAVVLHFRLRRLLARHYFPRPHDYAIYTQASPQTRQAFRVDRPTYRWSRQSSR
jgi:glycosyltransferase involved in cell wall biosynthesis